MFVIAHAGHWTAGALESLPLLIVAVVVAWRTYTQHARHARSNTPPAGSSIPEVQPR
jgi:hypothetical protein